MRTPQLLCVQPFFGAERGEKTYLRNEKERTFDHQTSRECIVSTLPVAGCVVEEKQGLDIFVCDILKYVNCMVDLVEEVVGSEPTIPILPRPEDQLGFAVNG